MNHADPATQDAITRAVVASMASCRDERLRTVMSALARHMHSLVREVALTEAEWFDAIRFLTAVGDITDDKRQEFILLSDTLGLSMQVITQNQDKPDGCTEATVLGPFYLEDSPEYENGADLSNGAKGELCFVSGQVRGLDGAPIGHALIEVWQADEDGNYDVQLPARESGADLHRARGKLRTDDNGRFHFRTILAESYPIPQDGPVGKMLDKLGRHPWRPAHLHFMLQAPGYAKLTTHVFRRGDRYLDSDAVFGVRPTLIADWIRHEAGIAPDGSRQPAPFYTLDFDFVLARL